ncbi:uncharacterized protein LOC124776862 [Schistocerca piceifrons]|uniref:uncharacterized protein LOC124776862 n=1 Tax=Schistocerca piceifrons TaxID=274613 RepID=UPI001F5E969D|nr:uncharacterized protein LOC124776862 [Schistocerca piceifrons]
MQKAFIFVVVVVACVGASFAQVTCSDHCLDLAEKANYARDSNSYQDLIDEFHGDGCDDGCLLYQLTSSGTPLTEDETTAEDGGSARIRGRSHSRGAAASHARLTALHHRRNHQ